MLDLDKLENAFNQIKDTGELVAFSEEYLPQLINELRQTRMEVVKALEIACNKKGAF